jgi:hypothetical protein
MALSTPAEKEAARLKKQAKWNEDRAYKRLNDDDFIAREQAATQKSNAFAKAAKAFARAHLAVFDQWQKLKGTAVAPSAAPQSHLLSPPPAPDDQPFEFPVTEKPDAYLALGNRPVPTAPWLERRRLQLKPDNNVLTQIGIDLK